MPIFDRMWRLNHFAVWAERSWRVIEMSTSSDLEEFIAHRMRMSHIYQPVMLRELLLRGGRADVEEIARALLAHDPSQVEYYALRVRDMVGRVLTANGVTEVIRDGRSTIGYRLPNAEALADTERQALIDLCDEKIDEFIARRGERIWSHRRLSSGYIPGTARYEVLKRAKFRCELCGISADEKAIEVDHIIPRNSDGSDDPSNLQALCYSCNATKRDRDDADFRGIAEAYRHRVAGCPFCDMDPRRMVAVSQLCFAVRDAYPVTPLHTLVIPKRHATDYFELFQPELNAVNRMLAEQRDVIHREDSLVSGFNVGVNSGTSAGQTVPHCHIHLIPRREGDVEAPRGGIRGVIPDRREY